MFNFDELLEGNEALRAILEEETEGGETSVTIEQKIEVETEVAEEVEVAAEAEEAVEEVEEVAEAVEKLCVMYDQVELIMDVVRKHGYTRPIAELVNANESLSAIFSMELPATESLDLVGSKYDSNIALLEEGQKNFIKRFWDRIKALIAKLKEKAAKAVARVRDAFSNTEKVAKRLALTAKGRTWKEDTKKTAKIITKNDYLNGLQTLQKAMTGITEATKSVNIDKGLTNETVESNKGRIQGIIADARKLPKESKVTAGNGEIGGWKISDASNADIVVSFYKKADSMVNNLMDFMNKADKLQMASFSVLRGAITKEEVESAREMEKAARNAVSVISFNINNLFILISVINDYTRKFTKIQRTVISCTMD